MKRIASRARLGTTSALGLAASIPWCCVMPAVLATFGFGAASAARWLGPAAPLLLGIGVILFGRAHYLMWFRHQGSPAARAVTLLSTFLAAALWVVRLS